MREFQHYRDRDTLRASVKRERRRQEILLERDRKDAEAEERRRAAEIAIANGGAVDPQEAVVEPTREWLKKGETVPYRAGGKHWTDRPVTTVRRRLFDAITHLASRGILDDQQIFACKWFRDRHEAAQLSASPSVASYGETIRADPTYGHLPSTEWAAQARADVRWAQSLFSSSGIRPFHLSVVDNMPVEQIAKTIRRRTGMTRMMIKDVAEALASALKRRAETIDEVD